MNVNNKRSPNKSRDDKNTAGTSATAEPTAAVRTPISVKRSLAATTERLQQ